jgi:uncharacterized protein
MEFRKMDFELRDIDSQTGEFEGIISTPSLDTYGTIFEPSAFKKTARETKGEVAILYHHDPQRPIGLSSSIDIGDEKVTTRGMIDLDIELGRNIFSGMKKRYINELSIGFSRVKEKWDKVRNAMIIKEVRLFEYSLITRGFASNRDAGITSVRSIPTLVGGLRAVDIDQTLVRQAIRSLNALLVEPAETTQQLEHEPAEATQKQERSNQAMEREVIYLADQMKSILRSG